MLSISLIFSAITSFSQLISKEFRPQIGIGSGYFNFLGEVNNQGYGSPAVGQLGLTFDVSRKITQEIDLGFTYLHGTMTANQVGGDYLNFQTDINSISVYGMYNWGHFVKNDIVKPYTYLGFETFEFNSKTDRVDASGNPYYYWSDGSVMNLTQTAPNASDANKLKRDYNYETDLRGLNLDGLGNYSQVSFAIPVGLGVQFNISERCNMRLGTTFHFTFTDNIDNISSAGKGSRKGNAATDYFMFNAVSLHYDLIAGAARSKKDFQFVDYFAVDISDNDRDGVFNWFDKCPGTPKGVEVDSCGCGVDTDLDGIPDYKDKEVSAPSAFVDSNGVEVSDAAYEKWYRRYIDSVDISVESMEKLLAANKTTPNIYRVLVGEYPHRIPAEHVEKFLAQPDIIAALVHDTNTAYLVGKFADIETAKKRQKELLDQKFPMAKIVIQKGNEFIPVDDFDKLIQQEKEEKAKEKLKDFDGQYAIQLGSTPASANAEDKIKFLNADKNVKTVEGEKNSTNFLIGAYKDLTTASVDLSNVKKEFKDAKVVKVQDGKIVDDKDSSFFTPPVKKEPDPLTLLNGKYAVKTTKITDKTTAAEKQKIDKITPDNLKVNNQDGTKDVLSNKSGFESFENAKKEADLLKQKGFKTEIVKVEDGKLNTVIPPVVVPKDPIVTPVENKLKEGEYAVKIGKIDANTSPEVKAKLEKTAGAVKIKNEDGSVDVVLGTTTPDLTMATKKLNEAKTKGFKSPEILKVQDGKLVKATGGNDIADKTELPKDTLKKNPLEGKFSVKVGEFDKGVSTKDMDKILNIPDVVGTSTVDPSKTTYTAGMYNTLDSAKARSKQLNEGGFNTEVVEFDGKKFKNVPGTKSEATQQVVKTNKVVFRVQLGAFKNKVSDAAFRGEHVVEFKGNDGLMRYATGSFDNYKSCAEHKIKMKEKGFSDAFITAYKDGEKVSVTELVNPDEFKKTKPDSVTVKTPKTNLQKEIEQKKVQEQPISTPSGTVYKVQVVAVAVSAGKPEAANKIADLEIEVADTLRRYMSGNFKDFSEAQKRKDEITSMGFPGAYVVAYKDGKRAPLSPAISEPTGINPVETKYDNKKDSINLALLEIHVQVGLFSQEPPEEIKKIFATIPDLKIETTPQGLKKYSAGNFKNPSEAAAYKESLKAKGLQDAFLVAYYQGIKINLATAIQYYEKRK